MDDEDDFHIRFAIRIRPKSMRPKQIKATFSSSLVTFGGEAEGEMVYEFDRGEKWGGGGLNTLEGDCSADGIKSRGGRILELGNRKKRESYLP